MKNKATGACFPILLVCASPAPAQLDSEGTRLMNNINRCIEKYAFEKDDGVKSPETIADETMAACKVRSIAFEDYAVRHSVKMTDQVRSDLRGADHQQAVELVSLNRESGRVHARNH